MNEHSLENCVKQNLQQYFEDLGDQSCSGVWDMVMTAVEKPLIEFVLAQVQGNQSKAANMLGINRNTLRKKIDQYHIQF